MQVFVRGHVPGSHSRHVAVGDVLTLGMQCELRLLGGTDAPAEPAAPAAEDTVAFS